MTTMFPILRTDPNVLGACNHLNFRQRFCQLLVELAWQKFPKMPKVLSIMYAHGRWYRTEQ